MKAALLGFGIGLMITFFRMLYIRKRDKEADEIRDVTYGKELKKYLEQQETRDVSQGHLNDDDFWNIIDTTRGRSKENYKNQIGLLYDEFRTMNSDDIINFYTTYLMILSQAISAKGIAAYSIISGAIEFVDIDQFFEWMLCQGEIKLNNYTHNPELLVNAKFDGIGNDNMLNFLSDAYFHKANKILPEISGILQLDEEQIKQKDLPSLFPQLWNKFITVPR